MDKSLIVAAHEFKTNLKRKEYLLFAFVVPAFLLFCALVVSFVGNRVTLSQLLEMQTRQAFFAFPSTIAMVFSMAIFLSANFLLQSISTEKENRIMEVLMSTISFRQLLTGKILGLGMLGLVQFASWVSIGLIMFAMASPQAIGTEAFTIATITKIALYLVFFMLGYLLYAALLAAIGALTETKMEAQQISSVVTIFSLIPALCTLFLNEEGDLVFGTVLTLFPLTAPITTIIRVFLEKITMPEILASGAMLVFSTIVVIAVATRLFRAEILMYGKKFSPRQLMRFIVQGR